MKWAVGLVVGCSLRSGIGWGEGGIWHGDGWDGIGHWDVRYGALRFLIESKIKTAIETVRGWQNVWFWVDMAF